MLAGLASSFLGGGGSAIPAQSAASGDASAGLDASFAYNGAFQVGGSGNQDQDAGLSTGSNPGTDNTLVFVSIGVGVLAILIGAIALSKK